MNSVKTICFIPARMGSSRFPGKPLALISGKPLIQRVYDAVVENSNFDMVYVATPDEEIRRYCIEAEISVVMTGHHHERATDRCQEALENLNLEPDFCVMVQGDEPLLNREMFDVTFNAFQDVDPSQVFVTNLAGPLTFNDLDNPNVIKVVVNNQNNALYMSRAHIPACTKEFNANIESSRQVCIIGFTPAALKLYANLKPTPLEIAESIDMLRYLENGYSIKMLEVKGFSHAVDRLEDVPIIENELARN
jgi:3-deoxy-manno-octulosonate cytidylyltransferase (CMP-KDO synthetase)